MNFNLNLLKIFIIYVITQVRYYWRLVINNFLELVGYIEVTDLSSARTYFGLMRFYPLVTLESKEDNRYRFYVVTTCISGTRYRIVMHCTSIELKQNIRKISLRPDHEIKNKIDRTIYSNVLRIKVDHDGGTWESNDLRGWNYNLCVLRTKINNFITEDQWIRAGVFHHLTTEKYRKSLNLQMEELNMEVMTLDDLAAF
jgi:hypothetical protein